MFQIQLLFIWTLCCHPSLRTCAVMIPLLFYRRYTDPLRSHRPAYFTDECKTNFSHFIWHLYSCLLSSLVLCLGSSGFWFFRLLGLQDLVNPGSHLAQLFDLDLALWYPPLLKMILILNDTAHCWKNETSVAASHFECPCEFIKSTSFHVPTQICTTAPVWKNIQGQKYLMWCRMPYQGLCSASQFMTVSLPKYLL